MKKSRDPNREKLIAAIGECIMRWQDATETFDERVGKRYNLNSADRRCLSFVSLGPQTASAIAAETALTRASVTSLIDRLEARNLVRRIADSNDRRKVLVEATETAQELIARNYLPVARAGADLLAEYPPENLVVIEQFLRDALALQKRMTAELFERPEES